MAEPIQPTDLETLLAGSAGGHMAVGSYRLRMHPEHGAAAHFLPPDRPSEPSPRTPDELMADTEAPSSPGEPVDLRMLDQLSGEERRLVAILAGADGAPVGIDPLREIAGPDADRILDRLRERRLVRADGPRYCLRVELDESMRQAWQVDLWQEKLWERLIAWAERHPGRIHEEAASLRQAVESAAAAESWETVRRLGRAIEGPLALAGRWGAWGQVIDRVLAAAERLRNVPARAWALHQRGTRALCLGDPLAAREDLTQALQIRESLGDVAGAAVTRHNLGLLLGPPPSAPSLFASPVDSRPRGLPSLLGWLIVTTLLILVGLIVGGRSLLSRPSASETETAAETPAVTEESDPGEEPSPDESREEESTVDALTTSLPDEVPETTDLSVVDVPVGLPEEPEQEIPTGTPEPVDTVEPEPVEAPKDSRGWCCLEGRVSRSARTVCQESQGNFFNSRREARRACAAARPGCCVDGVFQLDMSAEECARLEGTPMTPAEAPLRCASPEEGGR